MKTYFYTFRNYAIALTLTASVLFASCDDKNKIGNGGIIPKLEAVSGIISYDDGKPAEGVTVSDGYTCVITDKDGRFKLIPSLSSYYIYYSNPSDAKVDVNDSGLPCFFKKLTEKETSYNFKLTRIVPETRFRMLAIGDIQPTTTAHVARFKNETVADIKAYIPTLDKSLPTYAVQLGDLVNNKWELYPNIIKEISTNSTGGIPIYSVIGNHDHVFPSTNNLSAQRKYESLVAPVNYSFNRGDVHFLVMDDIIHTAQGSPDYDDGFLDWQYKWAIQDLSNVDYDKVVVLCVHAPFSNKFSSDYFEGTHYYNEMLELLSNYKKAYILAGHTHTSVTTLDHNIGGKNIHEYVVGAACGGHWNGTIGSDGAPNGYSFFEFDGTELKNTLFKGTLRDEGYQIRAYRCDDFPEFEYSCAKFSETFKWGLVTTATRAVINIWNYNPSWHIEVYEDGVKTVDYSGNNLSNFGSKTLRDMWAKYYFYDTLHYTSNVLSGTNSHSFWYTMKNPTNCTIRVVAKDEFGHSFECNEFTSRSDQSCMVYE